MTRTLWSDLLGAEVRRRDVRGIGTRSIEAGSGPAVVFLHGTGSTAEAFARNIMPFADRFAARAIDLIGHGLTDAPPGHMSRDAFVSHVVEYMDVMGIDRAHLVGNSLGGWIAVWTSLLHPDRVSSVVNVVGPHFAVPVSDEVSAQAQAASESLKHLSKQLADEPTRENLRARLGYVFYDVERSLTDELVDVRWAMYERSRTGQQVASIIGNPGPENLLTPERLSSITRPTLLVWTDHNPAPAAVAESALRYIPGGRLAVMTHCGHWPQWEDPPTFNRLVMDFCQAR